MVEAVIGDFQNNKKKYVYKIALAEKFLLQSYRFGKTKVYSFNSPIPIILEFLPVTSNVTSFSVRDRLS